MPSKKRKYNARFPAGRIKKIMQTDEEVGKVAQALFVESLLSKALQVTMTRNAKTLSPSHVKQCILAESKFDFLRDLVKNIPDVSAAEEKEMMSAESSPNSSRFSDTTVPPRRIVREDSNSSSSCDIRVQPLPHRETLKRAHSAEIDIPKTHKIEVPTSTIVSTDIAIDLSKKHEEPKKNFYQETLHDDVQHRSVITVNPSYTSPQPSTSYTTLKPKEPIHRVEIPVQRSFERQNSAVSMTSIPRTPVTPILNIDFSKNITNPEIKVLDTAVAGIVGTHKNDKKLQRQNSRTIKPDIKREVKPVETHPVDIDRLNSGNLQIDEDYDV
ncbi:hypothetical protein K1T71_013939 [Dendrolimus kikuchii]|uniref:Uncharacterized protein n=1 Tax=Dendrolimus kikuchii TaxID=765133 RepID=A0ACC1CG58_9NEOP|nr:hypothetical protein K1T71_013939 [Dendrolimus kikuchii]